MRVLVTGATATQVGRPNRLGFVSTPAIVAEGLRALGHRVEHRPVTPGEALAAFHRVVVFLTPPLVFGSLHHYGALWALATARRPLAAVDDWQLGVLLSQLRSVAKNGHRLLWDCLAAKQRPDWMGVPDAMRPTLEGVSDVLAENAWPWPTGVPLFPWAKPELLPIRPRVLRAFDPSPLAPVHRPEAGGARARRWLLPAIADHRDWLADQALAWPVDYVGGTLKQARQDGLPRYQEADLVRHVYPRYAATLCVPYKHAGSGWWRVRYLHAAGAGTALGGAEAELAPIGGGYHVPPAEMERLSRPRLADLAARQGALLRRWHVTGPGARPRLLAALADWVR